MTRLWLRSLLLVPLAVLMVLVLAGSGATPVVAEDGGAWSPPVKISGQDPRTGGWFPSIAADLYGHVHIVWNGRAARRPAAVPMEDAQRVSDGAGWLLYARQDGRGWTAPTEIGAVADEGDVMRPALTSDPGGRLHLLYLGLDLRDPKSGSTGTDPVRYASADALDAERPSAWSGGVTFSRRGAAYFSEIVTDSQGVLHAITTEPDARSRYAVYYRRSDDRGQTWTPSLPIETTLAVSRWRAQLKVGPNDDLNAVWEVVDPADPTSRVPVGFVYARSTDGGQTWTSTVFAPPRQEYVYPKRFEGTRWRVQPAVGVDGRGQIVLVWREYETDVVYFQRSTDGAEWTPPARVGGVARGVARPFDRYDMALDGASRLHLVMVAYPDNASTMALLHAEWLGYSWSSPEPIVRAVTAPYPEWPRIAVGEGNRLHVAWFGGSLPTVERTAIGIWYGTKRLDQPALPVASLPASNQRPGPPATPRTASEPPLAAPGAAAAAPPVGTSIAQSSQPVRNVDASPLPVVQGLATAATVLVVFLLFRVLQRGGLRR